MANKILLATSTLGTFNTIVKSFQSPNIGGVEFKALLKEEYKEEIQVTENPIENGSNINDHIIIMGARIVLSIGESDTNNILDSSIVRTVGSLVGVNSDKRTSVTYGQLLDLQKRGQLFEYEGNLKTYKNMILLKVGTMQDKDYNKAFLGDIEMQEVLIVGGEDLSIKTSKPNGLAKIKNEGLKIASEIKDKVF